jgi:hypothetical protein
VLARGRDQRASGRERERATRSIGPGKLDVICSPHVMTFARPWCYIDRVAVTIARRPLRRRTTSIGCVDELPPKPVDDRPMEDVAPPELPPLDACAPPLDACAPPPAAAPPVELVPAPGGCMHDIADCGSFVWTVSVAYEKAPS